MAHGLESLSTARDMAHFAFSGKREGIWHRGGYGQSGLYSARDMAGFAEFAARVSAEPLGWLMQPSDEPDGFPNPQEFIETDHRALIRHAPNGEQSLMRVVTQKYDLAHHLEDLTLLQTHLFGDPDAAVWETLGGLYGFKRFFASAPLAAEGEVGPGDPLLLRLVFDTGYGYARKLRLTTIRPVCANTLRFGELAQVASAWAGRHIGESQGNLKAAADSLRLASAAFDDFLVNARAMRRVELLAGSAVGTVGDFMRAVAQAEETDPATTDASRALALELEINLYRQPGWDGSASLWQTLNAVTHYADHSIAQADRANAGLSAALSGSWLDSGPARLKDRALVLAQAALATAGAVV